MTRTVKTWAGIAVSAIIVLLFLIQRNLETAHVATVREQKYYQTRLKISWQLMNLRHEYSTQQIHVSQNTVLEIKELWHNRDLLFYVLHHRKSRFQADSLINLERLIDKRTALTTVLREIQRIEQINETN
jgi:hypothetical protein